MTRLLQPPTGTVNWAETRSTGRTGSDGGAAHLDQSIEFGYSLLPLHLLDPDATALADASEYARWANKYVDVPTADLLDRLSDDYGLMWLTIARAAQVSVPALRKWRQGGNPTLQKKAALARLLAACQTLQTLGVSDVAAWLSTPIRLDQSRLRVELLTLDDTGETFVALAQDKISQSQALDALDPTWRERFQKPTTEVTFAADETGTVHLADL